MTKVNISAEKETVIAAFQNLLVSEGWKLIEEIQDKNIEEIQRQLEEGTGEDETKQDVDLLRAKLKLMRELKNTPRDIIAKLQYPESEVADPDPYDTISSVEKKKLDSVTE